MKIWGDITSPRLLHLKGILFVILGGMASALLIVQMPTIKTIALLCIAVWAFCRFYYYLFYVLERYVGREERFAGVFDALKFMLRRRTPALSLNREDLPEKLRSEGASADGSRWTPP